METTDAMATTTTPCPTAWSAPTAARLRGLGDAAVAADVYAGVVERTVAVKRTVAFTNDRFTGGVRPLAGIGQLHTPSGPPDTD